MNGIRKAVALSAFAVTLASGAAFAQDHHDGYVRHDEWKKGYHMKQEDWARAQRVDDWRAHHLYAPPAGYEWRQADGYYVLANPQGVVSASVVIR